MLSVGTVVRGTGCLLLALLLGACGMLSPYRPLEQGEGYADYRIAPNRYRVTYDATALTGKTRIRQYLLYRAAELTLDAGMAHFIVVREDLGDGRWAGMNVEGDASVPNYEFRHRHLWFGTEQFQENPSTATYEPLRTYTATIEIETLADGDRAPADAEVFDAGEILRALGPEILK